MTISLQSILEVRCTKLLETYKLCLEDPGEKQVHDVRVAARRFLAALDVASGYLKPGMLEKTGKRLVKFLKTLNPIRDAQVCALNAKLPDSPASQHPEFIEYLDTKAKKAAKKARKLFTTGAFDELGIPDMANLLSETAPFLTNTFVEELFYAADKSFASCIEFHQAVDPKHPETLHKFRLSFKRFRYTIEILSPREEPSPDLPPILFENLQNVQTMLGDIQDATVMLAKFTRWEEEHGVPHARKAVKNFEQALSQKIEVFMNAPVQIESLWRKYPGTSLPWSSKP